MNPVIVVGLPRGGVAVASEVAAAMDAPLDVLVVRKLGAPGHRELAIGAIAHGGSRVFNDFALSVPEALLEAIAKRETVELDRQDALYRRGRAALDVGGRDVVVVDDGLATGTTMAAAVGALREQQPAAIVVAVPVGSAVACRELKRLVNELVCLYAPPGFEAVGDYYIDFAPTTDEEVMRALHIPHP